LASIVPAGAFRNNNRASSGSPMKPAEIRTTLPARVSRRNHAAADQFGQGARMTMLLTVVLGSLGLALGVFAGLARASEERAPQLVARFYIWAVRGTPLVVQILFVYFALPAIFPFFQLSGFWSAVLALSVNVGAYNTEIIRASLQAVPKGQFEAARSTGLTPIQSYALVILPQAVRIALPPLVNNIVSLLKDSSLAYVIGVVELSLVGNRIQAESFRPVPVFITVACVYLAQTTILSGFSHALERWLSKGHGR
jgi:polar amino acid transport system permease protein